MSYRIFQKSRSEKVPVFLDAHLVEGYDYDKRCPVEGNKSAWSCVKFGNKVPYPERLFLVSNHDSFLEFDYYPYCGAYIISQELRDVFRNYSSVDYYQLVPLTSVDIGGQKNTHKTYFFLSFTSPASIIDYEESDYILRRGANKKLAKKSGYGTVGFDKIVLKRGLAGDQPFFKVTDSLFSQSIVLTDEIADHLSSLDLVGFDVVSLAEFADNFRKKNDPNYIDRDKVERMRAKRMRKNYPT